MNTEALTLRWYRPEDLHDLLGLFRAGYPRESWTDEDVRAVVADNRRGDNVLKVLVDAREVRYGALLYRVNRHDKTCRLRRVAVWPDCRRGGLGTFMAQTLLGDRFPLGAFRTTAHLGDLADPAAEPFLLSLGFALVDQSDESDFRQRRVFAYPEKA